MHMHACIADVSEEFDRVDREFEAIDIAAAPASRTRVLAIVNAVRDQLLFKMSTVGV